MNKFLSAKGIKRFFKFLISSAVLLGILFSALLEGNGSRRQGLVQYFVAFADEMTELGITRLYGVNKATTKRRSDNLCKKLVVIK